jgi:hypothetical protein
MHNREALNACAWPHDLTDEQILERLLTLNLERAEREEIQWFREEYLDTPAHVAWGYASQLDASFVDRGIHSL